ncbi:hypothetical protein [Salimicrobium salexigens]|uniref:hypothetical protein n=1 Tax=Salimicrobium salexigens TaxID=908941 RepID=UPI0009705B47|nr:hypothetical protein [Salimicrobium salexigens]
MYKIKEVKVLEGVDTEMIENEINRFLSSNENLEVIDIKYSTYEAVIDPSYLEAGDDDKEIRHTALLLIGEEV